MTLTTAVVATVFNDQVRSRLAWNSELSIDSTCRLTGCVRQVFVVKLTRLAATRNCEQASVMCEGISSWWLSMAS